MVNKFLCLIILLLASFSVLAQPERVSSASDRSFDEVSALCKSDYEFGRTWMPIGEDINAVWISTDSPCFDRPDLAYTTQGKHIRAMEMHVTVSWCYWECQLSWSRDEWWLYFYNSDHIGTSPAQLGPASCGASFGNPINAANGNKYEHIVDIHDERGLLNFDRYYNSDAKAVRDTLGVGWRHTYSTRLYPVSGSPDVIDLIENSGRRIRFTEVSGVWVPDLAEGGTLTPHEFSDTSLGWKYRSHQGEATELFDAGGHLVQIDWQGEMVHLVYQLDAQSRRLLSSVSDQTGRSLQFTYDSDARLAGVTNADGSITTYTYSSSPFVAQSDLLASVTYVDNKGFKYRYDEERLVGIDDLADNLLSAFVYDQWGKATSTQKAGGLNAYTITYPNSGALAQVSLDGVSYNQLAFEKVNNLKKPSIFLNPSCGGRSNIKDVFYHPNGQIYKTNTFSGYSSYYDYNSLGLEIRREDEISLGDRAFETSWDSDLRLPTERRTFNASNALIAKSTTTYNTRGQPLVSTRIDPATLLSRATTRAYCEAADVTNGTCPILGLPISVDGPRTDVSDITSYAYYSSDDVSCASSSTTCPYRKGDLWKVTDAIGRVTEMMAYDGAGRVLSAKSPNGIVTDYAYHSRGWLVGTRVRGANNSVETDDQATLIEYWPTGLIKKITTPGGSYTSYVYDTADRLTDISDNAGNTVHYTLDRFGHRTAETVEDSENALRRTLSRVYNQLGQLQTAKDAYNHSTNFDYDSNGFPDTVTDAIGRVTDHKYDSVGRLLESIQDKATIKAKTQYRYDPLGNLIKVIDPNNKSTTYLYNGLDDLTQLDSPDTGITTYTYDSGGNLKTQADARGITSTYSYDAINRLTGITYPTTSLNVEYSYDMINAVCTTGETFAVGRLTRMTDSSGTTLYCYDRFGNLTRKRQTTNGQVFELRYAYNISGQLLAVTYPDGAIVDYVRDGQGRITEVGAAPAGGAREVLLHQATYHPFGPVAGWTYGNGRTLARPLNQNYQPTAVVDNAADGLSLGYQFDPVGNLSQLTNGDQSAVLAQYGYDALNRLTDVKDGPTGTVIEHYGYDAIGNRTSLTNAGGTTAYTYPTTNHRLTQVGATPRSYDNAGNTIQIGGVTKEFVYNDAGRMSQVKAGGTATMNYQLNGRGEQVRKYLGTGNTYTVYDEAGRWIGDYDNAGNALQQAIWLDDLPVGLLASNQLKYLQPDHLGTPRTVIDPVQDVAIWTWELKGEAFGATLPNQDPDGNGAAFVFNMRFPGQRYDAASGLNYNYFRDGYDATTGRYSQSDPIGLNGGISTYAYAASAPTWNIDRNGLQAVARLPLVPPAPALPNQSGSSTYSDGDYYDSGGSSNAPLGSGGRPVRVDRNGIPIPTQSSASDSNVIAFPADRIKNPGDTCPPDDGCELAQIALQKRVTTLAALHMLLPLPQFRAAALVLNKEIIEHNGRCPTHPVIPFPFPGPFGI